MVKKKKSVNKRNKQLVQFIIMVLILGVIFLGFFYIGKINKYFEEKKINNNKYNDFDFYHDKNQSIWFTQIQIGNTPYNIPFYFHPRDLENISVQDNIEDLILKNKPSNVIISIPPDSNSEMALAGVEISKITGERYQILKIPTKSAFNKPVKGMPFATCSDSNEKTAVILFKEGLQNTITGKNKCIILEFKKGDAVRVADSLSYHLLKIM